MLLDQQLDFILPLFTVSKYQLQSEHINSPRIVWPTPVSWEVVTESFLTSEGVWAHSETSVACEVLEYNGSPATHVI